MMSNGEDGVILEDNEVTFFHSGSDDIIEKMRATSSKGHSLRLPLNLDLAAMHNESLCSDLQLVDDCKLRLFVCTWNMQGRLPKDRTELARFIHPNVHHIYCIGTQECQRTIEKSVVFRSKQRWEELLEQVVGQEYAMLESHTLLALHMIVFVRKNLLPFIKDVRTSAVSCGITEQIANKGGHAVSFTVGKTPVMFINCHLAAHQNAIQARNEHYHAIINGISPMDTIIDNRCESISTSMVVEPSPSNETLVEVEDISEEEEAEEAERLSSMKMVPEESFRCALAQFDHIFMFGDANYRINGTRKVVDRVLNMGMLEVLLANDQLTLERMKGNAFTGFQEGEIHFKPTYKFDKDSDKYDTSKKQRIPAWTDRILFRSNPKPNRTENCQQISRIEDHHGITLLEYNACSDCRLSDHRPVYARFLVQVDGLSHKGHSYNCGNGNDNNASRSSFYGGLYSDNSKCVTM